MRGGPVIMLQLVAYGAYLAQQAGSWGTLGAVTLVLIILAPWARG